MSRHSTDGPVQPDPLTSIGVSAGHAPDYVIPGRFFVVFRDEVTTPLQLAEKPVTAHGGDLHHPYSYALKGFAADLSDAAAGALPRHLAVA